SIFGVSSFSDETACLPLHIPNGRYSVNSQGWYNGGDTISVTCDEGYEPKDLITDASCSEGQWTAVPVRQSTSPILKCTEIDNGDFVEKTLKYLKYQCSAFYTLEGSDTVVCNSDGSWSTPPTCLDNFCIVDTSRYRNLENIGIQYVKSGDHQEFQCASSSKTSYGHCKDGQMTFGRCKYRHKLFVICTSKYLMLQLISSGQTD
uniref:Sushi domain-containing protein n=1 Tax=Sphaeramia orbicularis TaxID=375764 RepID=A0A673AG11_9TELE